MTTPHDSKPGDFLITAMLDNLLTELLPAGSVASDQARIEAIARSSRCDQLLDAGFSRRALDVARVLPMLTHPELIKLHGWNPSRRSIAIVCGAVGSGKTVAATWWALHRQSGDVGYVRAQTLAATGLDVDGDDAGRLAHSALVLDDLGEEGDDLAADFDELVDTYYADGRPLVITTRLTQTGLAARYSERVISRLAHASMWVDVRGPSKRQ